MRKEIPVESERKFAPSRSGHWKPYYVPKAVARAVLKGDDNAVGNSSTLEASVEFDERSCAVAVISIATDAVAAAETRRADGRRARVADTEWRVFFELRIVLLHRNRGLGLN